jgi:hypothetical protein
VTVGSSPPSWQNEATFFFSFFFYNAVLGLGGASSSSTIRPGVAVTGSPLGVRRPRCGSAVPSLPIRSCLRLIFIVPSLRRSHLIPNIAERHSQVDH